MTIPPGLAAELDLLSQALDLPGTDIAETLTRLAADARSAIDSYLGLSVTIHTDRSHLDLTVLDEGAQPAHVRTSLLIPLPATALAGNTAPASVTLILYAATPGAFTDLAADLAWITGRALVDFPLDGHLTIPLNSTSPTASGAISNVNQALGVLIGRGSTPEQAERDLRARAVTAGIDLHQAATLLLAALNPPEPEPDPA